MFPFHQNCLFSASADYRGLTGSKATAPLSHTKTTNPALFKLRNAAAQATAQAAMSARERGSSRAHLLANGALLAAAAGLPSLRPALARASTCCCARTAATRLGSLGEGNGTRLTPAASTPGKTRTAGRTDPAPWKQISPRSPQTPAAQAKQLEIFLYAHKALDLDTTHTEKKQDFKISEIQSLSELAPE